LGRHLASFDPIHLAACPNLLPLAASSLERFTQQIQHAFQIARAFLHVGVFGCEHTQLVRRHRRPDWNILGSQRGEMFSAGIGVDDVDHPITRSQPLSITIMEIVDISFMLAVPGAMDAQISEWLFWISLAAALVTAGVAAYPANRWLISRGRGHAIVHESHRSVEFPDGK